MADYTAMTVTLSATSVLTGGAFAGSGGAIVYYVNRVYDSVAGKFVPWTTATAPDPTGASYPGPGVFGVTTTDYVVEHSYYE